MLKRKLNNEYFRRWMISVAKHQYDPNLIRNIGICAHIDSGKTTVTEKLLYLTGRTKFVGNVDDGNTVTDSMEMERNRGITIQSAAVTSFYKNHRINLIDTPGHVDFTIEVERSLRILDGVVTLLDGSAGVQAQTLNVWKQAVKNELPNVFFVNKMDKPNSDFKMSIDSVENKLQLSVVPIVVPFFKDKKVEGFLNLLDSSYLILDDKEQKWIDVAAESSGRLNDLLLESKQDMFERIANVDDKFGEIFLETEKYTQIHIHDAILGLKNATLSRRVSPIACGSALRSTRSVVPLLDAIINFLPSPLERKYNIPDDLRTCGMVFKIAHDKRLGQLSFVRMYKGLLNSSKPIVVNNNIKGAHLSDSQIKLFIPFSDDIEPVDHVDAHNICVISGLNNAVTGDTLLDASVFDKKIKDYFHFKEIGIPEPVFYCSVEPPNLGSKSRFEKALSEIVVEDPSFRVRKDQETGQTIVETMGELHAEVLKYRLQHDYKLNVFMGRLQISYREIIDNEAEYTAQIEDTFDEHKQSCSLTLKIEPSSNPNEKFKSIHINLDEEGKPTIRHDWLKSINEGCKNALLNGPVLGCPVQGVTITLRTIQTSGGRINSTLLSACASTAIMEALKKSGTYVIEPVMLIEIELFENEDSGRSSYSSILHELTKRRAIILNSQQDDVSTHIKKISAKLPLAETTGISKAIRKASSGFANFHMTLTNYQRISPDQLHAISQNE